VPVPNAKAEVGALVLAPPKAKTPAGAAPAAGAGAPPKRGAEGVEPKQS